MKRLAFFLLMLLILIVSSQIIHAQSPDTIVGEHIKNFDESVVIADDGKINVVENITYDFGYLERHGILRDIPLIKTNGEGKKFKMKIDVLGVTDEQDKRYHYQESVVDNVLTIKIGDANRTISGVHTYTIEYEVSGALTYFNDHDELYWNVTGNGWDIPIASSTATINFASPETAAKVANVSAVCYTGYAGESGSDCIAQAQTNFGHYATNAVLSSQQGFTMVFGFPKNTVAVLEPQQVVNFFDTPIGKIIGALMVVGAVVIILWWYIIYPIKLVYKWFKQGRDPKGTMGVTSAWFEGPKADSGRTLLPAITGTLIDERADFADISATIVNLAQRGYLKIEERKKNDFYFMKRKNWDDDMSLEKFETTLLNGIFSGASEVRIKDKKLYVTIQNVQQDIYDEVVRQKFFPEDPQKIRNFYTGVAVAGLATANVPLFISAIIFGRNLPRKTVEGVNAANVAKSLKNFLSSQERQLEFQAKKQMMFEKLLPFAIAFGVEEIWARRFEDLKMKQPDWYQGYGTSVYNPYLFTRNINSSFAATQAAAAPPHSSSSGFSSGFSGGSSGGGGGGGGGGSW